MVGLTDFFSDFYLVSFSWRHLCTDQSTLWCRQSLTLALLLFTEQPL